MSPEQAKARHEFCQARRALRNAKAEVERIEWGNASTARLAIAKGDLARAERIYERKRQVWEAMGSPA